MTNTNDTVSRRDFMGLVASSVLLPALPAWRLLSEGARLSARPHKPTEAAPLGLTPLWNEKPGAFLYVPKSYDPAKRIPLVVALHGAGGRSAGPLRNWTPQADGAAFALLVPESTGSTWDAIRGDYGDDVASIDRALKLVFARVNVDRRRVVLQGFSDGASYGLGLALNNTDLFKRVVANSAGFITDFERVSGAKPSIFVSHGTKDPILPYTNAVRRVVPQLKSAGCAVEFHEFEGGHMVPPDIAAKAANFIARV